MLCAWLGAGCLWIHVCLLVEPVSHGSVPVLICLLTEVPGSLLNVYVCGSGHLYLDLSDGPRACVSLCVDYLPYQCGKYVCMCVCMCVCVCVIVVVVVVVSACLGICPD
jgi:hypothetical protein